MIVWYIACTVAHNSNEKHQLVCKHLPTTSKDVVKLEKVQCKLDRRRCTFKSKICASACFKRSNFLKGTIA